MPDQTPEALAKWHERCEESHRKSADELAGLLPAGRNDLLVQREDGIADKHRATAALLREQAAERERIIAALNLDGASLGPGSEATTDDILRRIADWRDDREQAWAEVEQLRRRIHLAQRTADRYLNSPSTGDESEYEAYSAMRGIIAALAAKEASRG